VTARQRRHAVLIVMSPRHGTARAEAISVAFQQRGLGVNPFEATAVPPG
jgi:hypothetical protein